MFFVFFLVINVIFFIIEEKTSIGIIFSKKRFWKVQRVNLFFMQGLFFSKPLIIVPLRGTIIVLLRGTIMLVRSTRSRASPLHGTPLPLCPLCPYGALWAFRASGTITLVLKKKKPSFLCFFFSKPLHGPPSGHNHPLCACMNFAFEGHVTQWFRVYAW